MFSFEVWCLPSGGVETGESLAEAAVRETREETGLEVELTRLVGIYSRVGDLLDMHAVLFAARPVGGSLQPQPGETLAVRFFPFDQLPGEIVSGHPRRIADALQGAGGSLAVKQKMYNSNPQKIKPQISREELYALRDRSGLSRRDFYVQYIKPDQLEEDVQVGG